MRAFVFSGGANRGSLQAGATLALLEAGITPDIVVGSSVGSINSAVLACNPSLEGVLQIAERWKTIRPEEIFPGNNAVAMWRLLRGHGSLHDNHALRRFILSLLPPGTRRFADLAVPLFVTATRFRTGEMHLFGHDPQERIIDALMASCAVPPYLPPYQYRDELYLDGGFVSNLPISAAVELGATEIWALEIGVDAAAMPTGGVFGTLARSVETLMRLQMHRERELVRLMQKTGVVVHHIQMLHYSGMDVRNFSHSPALMALGYASAQTYLAERRQLPTESTPAEISVRSKVSVALRTTMATQSNLARLRTDSVRSLWQRRRAVPMGLPKGLWVRRRVVPVPVDEP
ncbi:MAG: patatin-like phospholipase family protein [Herpetosiphonaceae bacterium]|nr:patatin-like phospholipase family protein [Herpetosiphonaceae bacterium]